MVSNLIEEDKSFHEIMEGNPNRVGVFLDDSVTVDKLRGEAIMYSIGLFWGEAKIFSVRKDGYGHVLDVGYEDTNSIGQRVAVVDSVLFNKRRELLYLLERSVTRID